MEKDPAAGENRRGADGRRYSPTRERILREIESRDTVTTAEITAATGLHENTVREHLERLRADGRIRRIRAQTRGRGRPGWRWQALRAEEINPYAGLALALADTLVHVAADPVAPARAAGSRWGAELAAQHPDAADDPRTLVVEIMREQGYAPGEGAEEILLHRCPLLAAAARRSDVVCAVHEGMIAGILRSYTDRADARLLPFHADGACVLHLRVDS